MLHETATSEGREATTPAQLREAVQSLARSTVLVVGDAMVDRYVYGSVTGVSPEAPVPVLSVEREVALPGGRRQRGAQPHRAGGGGGLRLGRWATTRRAPTSPG
jgi:hypothetical protein